MLLRKYRNSHGMTRGDLAPKFGITVNHLWRLETGRCRPRGELNEIIERVTDGAVTAQDHQDAWEAYRKCAG